ncbi:MAG: copper homeostasis protein cutC isoform [Acidobacteria bacterium]|jgi:copper homeostasis protein|nr:copper homeostasis protein cutC isoform [Acidobacteriota bacterium]
MKVTFHSALDMSRDPCEAMENQISVGIDRILTSGQQSSALEGLDLISDLVHKAGNRVIVIMPGGGINERNFSRILDRAGPKSCASPH